MSTKRLQKTIVEGGRQNYSKHERHEETRKERGGVRQYLSRVRHFDADEVTPPEPRWTPYDYKAFADKTQPVLRFLRSKLGQPWNDVHAEVHARFDTRTTPGRHIVHDHILGDVKLEGTPQAEYARFRINARGILVEGRSRFPRWRLPKPSVPNAKVEAWIGGRRVLVSPGSRKLYWSQERQEQGGSWTLGYQIRIRNDGYAYVQILKPGVLDVPKPGELRYATYPRSSITGCEEIALYTLGPRPQGREFSRADYAMWERLDFHTRVLLCRLPSVPKRW